MRMTTAYYTLHNWLSYNYPKTGKCEFCTSERKTAHALKKGKEYEKNRDNYFELCYPCHARYDQTPLSRMKLSRKLTNHKKFSFPVCQYDLDGNYIRKYPSISEAARVLGKKELKGSISRVCRGEYKTSGGYRWALTALRLDKLSRRV